MPEVLEDKVKEIGREIESKTKDAQEKWKAFDTLRTELAKEGADTSDSEIFKKAEDSHKEYATLAEELVVLGDRRERLWAMTSERGVTDPKSPERELRDRVKDSLGSRESHGARVVGSELYKAAQQSGVLNRNTSSRIGEVQLGQMIDRSEFHALITGASATSAGAFVEPDHRGFVAPSDRPLLLLDLITVSETDSDAVEYVRETGFTNNAAEVAEATAEGPLGSGTPVVTAVAGGVKPQSVLGYEKVSEAVVTIAHWIATTRRAVADAAQLRSMIDGRLRYGLNRRLDSQVVSGDGVGENILGILNTPGILSQTKGADSLVDATHKAITKVRLGFREPTAAAYHPNDWQEIRLAKDTVGNYLYGPPALAGAQTVWGLPVVTGAQFVEDNPLVGDFSEAELWLREGVQVLASDSHADFFIRNLLALLAEMRVAFGVPTPEAFCEVV